MQILLLACLILLNAFFAATEMAFVSLNDAKISVKAKEGDKKYKKDVYEEGSCDTIEEILQKYKSIIGDDK